jgi:hypothetical protein
MTTLAYWCRSCRAWWDAGVLGQQAQEIQRHQLHDPKPSGVWLKHPGQTECPSCGQRTTQDLPTAFVGRKSGA